MKVLQIINSHSNEVGGAERLSLQIHRGCLAKGVDSHLLCLMKAPASRQEKTYSLRFNTPYHPGVFFRLVRFLRQPRWRDVDVIHVHLFPAQPLVALAAKVVGLRAVLITTEHNTFNRRRQLPGTKVVDRFYYRFYQKVVCISEGTRTAMQEWLPELLPKLKTILNGIDVSKYDVPRTQKRNDQPLVVLSAGRLTSQKNYLTAIEAVEKMADISFEYWIAGHGELEDELRSEVKARGLDNKIKFLGFREDLPELFAQADVFLSTALWEGFGLSVAEAMAAGLPVVVSDVPGVTEVVGRESRSGVFVSPSSSDEVAARLSELLADSALRITMGDNGRRRAACFDVGRMIADYLQLYHEVCP